MKNACEYLRLTDDLYQIPAFVLELQSLGKIIGTAGGDLTEFTLFFCQSISGILHKFMLQFSEENEAV